MTNPKRVAVITGVSEQCLHPIPPVADDAPQWNIFRLAEAVTGLDVHVLSACELGQLDAIRAFPARKTYDHIILPTRFLRFYRHFLSRIWPLRLLVRRLAKLPDLLSWMYLRRAVAWLRPLQADLVFINNHPQYIRYLRPHVPPGRLLLFVRGEMGESRRYLPLLDGIVVNSRGMQTYVEQLLGGANVPVSLMHNSLGDEFHVPEETQSDRFVRAEKRLLFAGRIVPEKGVMELLEAFELVAQAMPNVSLTIYGASANHKLAGPLTAYETKVRARAARFAPDLVRFAGWVPSREMAPHYQQADLAVFPSVWNESFGMVALEAMRCGTPVVASSRAGFNELVLPGLTGLLVDPSDAPALAEAMLHILRDPAVAAKMGAAGRERSLLFTPQVAAQRFEEIVSQHLNGLPS